MIKDLNRAGKDWVIVSTKHRNSRSTVNALELWKIS
jgi:hypothetical protein